MPPSILDIGPKPVLIKANINGTICTFKVIVSKLDINTERPAMEMFPTRGGQPQYIAGKETTRISIEGIITTFGDPEIDDLEATLEDIGCTPELEALIKPGNRKLKL